MCRALLEGQSALPPSSSSPLPPRKPSQAASDSPAQLPTLGAVPVPPQHRPTAGRGRKGAKQWVRAHRERFGAAKRNRMEAVAAHSSAECQKKNNSFSLPFHSLQHERKAAGPLISTPSHSNRARVPAATWPAAGMGYELRLVTEALYPPAHPIAAAPPRPGDQHPAKSQPSSSGSWAQRVPQRNTKEWLARSTLSRELAA